ncbi:hypothetical protein GCM10027521_34380 [Amycolatopsis cihanbeyliensis]
MRRDVENGAAVHPHPALHAVDHRSPCLGKRFIDGAQHQLRGTWRDPFLPRGVRARFSRHTYSMAKNVNRRNRLAYRLCE